QLAGVKPEAMRVALHRLRRDSWIDSERSGRTSSYFLTPRGRAESAAASPRIYSTAEPIAEDWVIVVSRPGMKAADLIDDADDAKPGLWPVAENIAITSDASAFAGGQALKVQLTTANLPDWLRNNLIGRDLIEASARLCNILENLNISNHGTASFTPLETAILRTLIVHSWRRVRLRQPDLPDRVFPTDWKGSECRKHVGRLLCRLPRPDLSTLEAEI
ncbi:MAG: PaaX family transcriptional regulator C-terminal domain-containing protein, partial [Rhizobiaceae bacterium]